MITNRLRHILLDKDMSMNQLSEAVGMPYATIYRFGTMKTGGVTYETLDKICEYLEVQPGDILVYEPDSEPESAD